MSACRRLGGSTLETCVAVVGGLCAGIPLVPLNPKLGVSELGHILGDSQPEVVLGAPAGALDAVDAPPPIAAVDIDAKRRRAAVRRGPGRRPHRARHLHVGHDRAGRRARVHHRAAPSPRTSTRLADAWEWTGEDRARPRAAALPRPRPRARAARAAAPAAGTLRHLGRVRRRGRRRRARRDGATMLFGVPTMYHRHRPPRRRPTRRSPRASRPRGCSSPARRRCPRREFTAHRAARPASRSWSATA